MYLKQGNFSTGSMNKSMRRISRIGLLLASFLIAFAMLAIGRAALSAPDADVDLAITKNASIDPVIAGNPLTYTLSITNLGPSLATGVTITDTLPGGVIFTSASAGCIYYNTTGRVTCSLGDVDVGAEITRTVDSVVPIARARQRRWAPWAIAGGSMLVAAAAVLLFWLRAPERSAPKTAQAAPVPTTCTSRPADPLIGPIAREHVGDASTRIDTIFADRLDGYRERTLARRKP